MNKSELIAAIADSTDLSKVDAEKAVNSFMSIVTTQLKKGKAITLVGFGTFEVRRRQATTGRNPRTGASIKIPAANQPKFKPGKALKDAVN